MCFKCFSAEEPYGTALLCVHGISALPISLEFGNFNFTQVLTLSCYNIYLLGIQYQHKNKQWWVYIATFYTTWTTLTLVQNSNTYLEMEKNK